MFVGSTARPARAGGQLNLLDLGVAAAALALSLTMLAHQGFEAFVPGAGGAQYSLSSADLDLAGIALTAGSTLPLVAWRRSPLGVFAATVTAGVLLAALGYPIDLMLGPAIALYLLTTTRSEANPWTSSSVVIVLGSFAAYLVAATLADQELPGPELLHSGLAWAVSWFAGERARLRRELLDDLRERARRAEREAQHDRLLAAAEERARIARDLHDSAGHATSLIAVRAGAARLRHRQDPAGSLGALAEIEELARQTAAEIDHIVGNLRQGDSSAGVEAPSGVASLESLLAQQAASGLETTLNISGRPQPLSGAVDQAAYRILQEALTNASRHGSGRATVELVFGETGLDVTVTNQVDGQERDQPEPTDLRRGHGLVGMRERATLLDGGFEAQRTNGTFRVSANLPYADRSGRDQRPHRRR